MAITRTSLTHGHEEFIKSAISHLLEFPTSPIELKEQVILLKKAILPLADSSEITETHPFYELAGCLFSPTSYLQRLEHQDVNAILLNDVKRTILQLITNAIVHAARSAKLTLEYLEWDITEIENNLIKLEDKDTYFETSLPSEEDVNDYFPWESLQEEGVAYQAKFCMSTNQPEEVFLMIGVDLPNGEQWESAFPYGKIVDQYQNDYLLEQIPTAKEKCQKIAGSKILECLINMGALDKDILKKTVTNDNFLKVLAQKTWPQFLKNKIVTFDAIANLSDAETTNLKNPTVISLISHGICPIFVAKAFTKEEITIIQLYYQPIIKKLIPLEQIHKIQKDEVYSLSHPYILNLINLNLLSFSIARKMPLHVVNFISNPPYMDFILKHPSSNWQSLCLLTESQCYFFQEQRIVDLVLANIISFADVKDYPYEFLITLNRHSINLLLLYGKLDIHELGDLTINTIEFIDSNPHVASWIESGLVKASDIKLKKLPEFYVKIYSQRLFAIHQNTPYLFCGIADSIIQITNELDEITSDNVDLLGLKSAILNKFLFILRGRIQELLQISLSQFEKRHLKELYGVIKNLTDATAVRVVLSNLINKAQSILQKTPLPKKGHLLTFFRKDEDSDHCELKSLCKNLLLFSTFVSPAPNEKSDVVIRRRSMQP